MRYIEPAIIICLVITSFSTAQGNCGYCGTGHPTPPSEQGIDEQEQWLGGTVDPFLGSETTSIITTYRSGPVVYEPGCDCPPPEGEHLVLDPNFCPNCVYKCIAGYKFDENGECVRVPLLTESTIYANPSAPTQELETLNGEKIKPGDTITMDPWDKTIELGAKCGEFIKLIRGSMGNEDYSRRSSLHNAFSSLAEGMAEFKKTAESEVPEGASPEEAHRIKVLDFISSAAFKESEQYTAAKINLGKAIIKCGELAANPRTRPLLYTLSASQTHLKLGSLKDTSSPAAQIELNLESGPFLAEVVNNKAALDIDTGTVTVSSLGNNTFGVIYDPTNSVSYIFAYEQPIKIKPKNASLASFTLNKSQAAIVSTEFVSPTLPFEPQSINTDQYKYSSSNTSLDQSSIDQSSAKPTDNVQKLKQLKSMLDDGLITQEDYDSTKARILSGI